MSEISEDIIEAVEHFHVNYTCPDPAEVREAVAILIQDERDRRAIDKRFIRMMAYFYTNTNRWDLEEAGIIATGASGDTAWKRFSHNFDIFILKLSDEKQEALAALMSEYIFPARTAKEPPHVG